MSGIRIFILSLSAALIVTSPPAIVDGFLFGHTEAKALLEVAGQVSGPFRVDFFGKFPRLPSDCPSSAAILLAFSRAARTALSRASSLIFSLGQQRGK